MSEYFSRSGIVVADLQREGCLPTPVVDILDDYEYNRMTVRCEDGSLWRNENVWHSRQWERYIVPEEQHRE